MVVGVIFDDVEGLDHWGALFPGRVVWKEFVINVVKLRAGINGERFVG